MRTLLPFGMFQPLLNPSEALYAFMGWLTTRDQHIVIGRTADCAVLAELVAEFIEANDLPPPRDGWAEQVVQPIKCCCERHSNSRCLQCPTHGKTLPIELKVLELA